MRLAFGTKEKTGEMGLHILLAAIVNSFPETAGADYSEITLYDNMNNEFVCAVATGPERDRMFAGKKLGYTMDDRQKCMAQNVMESRNPLIVHDVGDTALSDADAEMVRRLAIKSIAVFPMFAGNRFVGSLTFDYDGHTHKFTREEVNGMFGFADLAAQMIDYGQQAAGK